MRIFLAHAKGNDDSEHTRWLRREIPQRLAKAQPDAEVVLALDEWRSTFSSAGSWEAWARQVGGGHDWQGIPTFDAYVLPTEYIGRGTAQIAAYAIAAGRGVVYWPKGFSRPQPVLAVEKVPDSDSWTHGWRVRTHTRREP